MNKKIISNRTRVIALLFLFLLSSLSFAQENDFLDDTIQYKNNFKLLLSPSVFQGLKINSLGTEKQLKSNFAPAFSFGFEYERGISNQFSLTVGGHWGNIPDHFKFDVRVPDFYELFGRNISANNRSSVSQYLYFPLYISYTIPLKKNRLLLLSTGASLNRLYSFESSFSYEYSLDTGMTYTDLKLLLFASYETQKEFFVSPFFKFGFRKYLENKNIFFDYGVKFNLTPRPVGSGKYSFFNLENSDFGEINMRFNYIGFEFVMGLGKF